MKLELFKTNIEKEKLLKVPVPERAFYLKSMNFLTDVSVIQKSCWHSVPPNDDPEPLKQSAALIQALFFIRHLAGLLFEGYELIRTGFWPNRLGQTYEIRDLEKIKDYFSKDNLIEKIRNKFAYHLDIDMVKNEIEKFPDNQELAIFFSIEMGNSLYKAGDDILLSAIVRLANKGALRPVLDEILLMATTFQMFFSDFIAMFHEKHLGFEPKDKIILDIPKPSEVNIPYFVSRH